MKYSVQQETNILEGHSLSEVAKKTGLHPSYISLLRRGKRTASPEAYEKIKKALTESQEVVE
jgi:transcriptional regulator with XRE-family HTH domain